MGNIFVDKNKDIVKSYYDKSWELKNQMDANRKTLIPEVAESENQKIREQREVEYNKAVQGITDNFNAVKDLLARANVIDTAEVPKEIEKIFAINSVYDLSADEVQAYVDEHSDNDTVMRVISDWIANKSSVEDGNMRNKYETVKIIRPVDKLNVYKKFAESALYIITQIHNDGTIMQRNSLTNLPVEPLEIDSYGDEESGKELYEVIGNGNLLAENKSKIVPERLLHVFDSITLNWSGKSVLQTA